LAECNAHDFLTELLMSTRLLMPWNKRTLVHSLTIIKIDVILNRIETRRISQSKVTPRCNRSDPYRLEDRGLEGDIDQEGRGLTGWFYLGILRFRDVYQCLGGRVHNIE
jgi:hypothetical protein